jgi:hypothetical protein
MLTFGISVFTRSLIPTPRSALSAVSASKPQKMSIVTSTAFMQQQRLSFAPLRRASIPGPRLVLGGDSLRRIIGGDIWREDMASVRNWFKHRRLRQKEFEIGVRSWRRLLIGVDCHLQIHSRISISRRSIFSIVVWCRAYASECWLQLGSFQIIFLRQYLW